MEAQMEKNIKLQYVINIIVRILLIMIMISVLTLFILIGVNPQNMRVMVLHDPVKSGWASLLAAGIIGAVLSGGCITAFKRRLFSRALSTIETEENRRLNAELVMVQVENIDLRSKNATLRGAISSIHIKVSQGIGVVQGAFMGFEEIEIKESL